MGSISLYQHIAETLREEILAKKWTAGETFPTEAALCHRFAASRITIRQALAILEEECLVVRRRGSGTYVSPHPTRRIPLKIDYGGSMRNHAPRVSRKLLTHKWISLHPTEMPSILDADPDTRVLRFERMDTIKGIPIAYDEGLIPEPYAHSLTRRDLATVDFLPVWAKRMKKAIRSCNQTIDALPCPAHVADQLQLTSEAPVLRSTEVYVAESGPVGMFVSYYHPAHISVTSTYHWHSEQSASRPGKQKK